MNVWTSVEIEQMLVGEQYKQTVKVAGKIVNTQTNNNPITFYNVKVYSSNWLTPAKAYIRNLLIRSSVGKAFIVV